MKKYDNFWKEFKKEKIQILVDDPDNIKALKFLDLYDSQSYSLEDLLETKIEIKSLSFSQDQFGHYLVVYSENGNEFKIDLFSFRYEIYARKVETTLTKLFEEFYANSAVRYIGETMAVDEKKQKITDTVNERMKYWYFKKKRDGRFYFVCDYRQDEELSADDFDSAVILYLNTVQRWGVYNKRMNQSHGGYPDPEPRKSLNTDL